MFLTVSATAPQVLGAGCVRPVVSSRSDVVIRAVLPERILHDGLPLHHLQHSAGDVHLHLPLPAAEEGKILHQYFLYT